MANQLGVAGGQKYISNSRYESHVVLHPPILFVAPQVERMAKQLGVAEGQVYTCETAAYFWLLHVLSRWEKFSADAAAQRMPGCVQELFPFKARPGSPCFVESKRSRERRRRKHN